MTDVAREEGYACIYTPTRWERFWRFMGFRFHLGDDPEGADVLPGWMRTDLTLNFDWSDRLRLLLTGKLRVSTTIHFDTPSPNVCKSRMDWQIFAPSDRLATARSARAI